MPSPGFPRSRMQWPDHLLWWQPAADIHRNIRKDKEEFRDNYRRKKE